MSDAAAGSRPGFISSMIHRPAAKRRSSSRSKAGSRRSTARPRGFAQEDLANLDTPAAYAMPDGLQRNEWALSGTWTVAGHGAIANEPGARMGFRFHARDVNLVMGPASGVTAIPFRVFVDGQLATASHGTDVGADGSGTVREQRTYQLIRQAGEISDRLVEIEFQHAGVEAYCFTFG